MPGNEGFSDTEELGLDSIEAPVATMEMPAETSDLDTTLAEVESALRDQFDQMGL